MFFRGFSLSHPQVMSNTRARLTIELVTIQRFFVCKYNINTFVILQSCLGNVGSDLYSTIEGKWHCKHAIDLSRNAADRKNLSLLTLSQVDYSTGGNRKRIIIRSIFLIVHFFFYKFVSRHTSHADGISKQRCGCYWIAQYRRLFDLVNFFVCLSV